jgi:hypothetical protein
LPHSHSSNNACLEERRLQSLARATPRTYPAAHGRSRSERGGERRGFAALRNARRRRLVDAPRPGGIRDRRLVGDAGRLLVAPASRAVDRAAPLGAGTRSLLLGGRATPSLAQPLLAGPGRVLHGLRSRRAPPARARVRLRARCGCPALGDRGRSPGAAGLPLCPRDAAVDVGGRVGPGPSLHRDAPRAHALAAVPPAILAHSPGLSGVGQPARRRGVGGPPDGGGECGAARLGSSHRPAALVLDGAQRTGHAAHAHGPAAPPFPARVGRTDPPAASD